MTTYIATSANPVSNVTLNAGDTLVVSSGGTATDITVNSGASADVMQGGSTTDLTIAGGGSVTIEGSAASVTDGGSLDVFGGSVQTLAVQSNGEASFDAASAEWRHHHRFRCYYQRRN